MTQSSPRALQVGKVFGIPLRLDYSWFLILTLLTLSYGFQMQKVHPQWSSGLIWGTGLVSALALFASVLLHELGHSLTARTQGIKVESITLFLFGGVAAIDRESTSPWGAFQVAIAGPLVSFGLGGLGWLLSQIVTEGSPPWEILDNFWQVNLVLGLFNLIPGLPLDGGQVLKALVWQITGSPYTGVRWAAMAGQGLGLTALVLGVTTWLMGAVGGLWIGLIGWFVFSNAAQYRWVADLQQVLKETVAADVLSREFRVLDAHLSLRRFADDYLLGYNPAPIYFVTADGRYRGFVTSSDLQAVERSLWERQTLAHILHPMVDLSTVPLNTPLGEVVNRLESAPLPRIVVLSPTGAVEGLIDRGDVMRALSRKLGWGLNEQDIRRIREEGAFPAGLRLYELSKRL